MKYDSLRERAERANLVISDIKEEYAGQRGPFVFFNTKRAGRGVPVRGMSHVSSFEKFLERKELEYKIKELTETQKKYYKDYPATKNEIETIQKEIEQTEKQLNKLMRK